MTITLKGIIKEHSIKLPDWVKLEDGSQVIVNIETDKKDSKEKKKTAEKLCGSWSNDPSIVGIFENIERERHGYPGRNVDFDVSS